MTARKFNHSGVDIYIPDDKKFEAILTVDGEDVKVGRKDFESFDEFKVWLEGRAGDLKAQTRLAKDGETRKKVAARELNEANEAVGKIRREDFDTDGEFLEASKRAVGRLDVALMDKAGAEDLHRTHVRNVEGMKETLGQVEKRGK
ncbi:hypothetical protein [Methyloceanibacter caenitepidi]|uniref:Uncharacterized protein n=1 Tax=Methyloceanibacter caenitepidi TaxID=1384459 RepID=A0A0A8K5S6_9HYPH|nr:hypothetical protein [Methyloceanibacter caenitepidi]BAQ18298.1 hypothetical protein GL4_2865 [Methyloceanibacter caenitepidi]